ncbi:MAG: hypothetical protein M3022_03375 [Actinomycetota bacterium]|nr:hypothetical protein [Actinomycetota bacterium]
MIPWPTKLAADHICAGGSAAGAVAVLYAAVLMVMGLSIAASWRYLASQPQLIMPEARPGPARDARWGAGARRALLGALAYVPALILAPLIPAVSFGFDAMIVV